MCVRRIPLIQQHTVDTLKEVGVAVEVEGGFLPTALTNASQRRVPKVLQRVQNRRIVAQLQSALEHVFRAQGRVALLPKRSPHQFSL